MQTAHKHLCELINSIKIRATSRSEWMTRFSAIKNFKSQIIRTHHQFPFQPFSPSNHSALTLFHTHSRVKLFAVNQWCRAQLAAGSFRVKVFVNSSLVQPRFSILHFFSSSLNFSRFARHMALAMCAATQSPLSSHCSLQRKIEGLKFAPCSFSINWVPQWWRRYNLWILN